MLQKTRIIVPWFHFSTKYSTSETSPPNGHLGTTFCGRCVEVAIVYRWQLWVGLKTNTETECMG